MNDDCILAILESLKLNDLYSFGSTCCRINRLAGDVFKRKYSDESIDVNIITKKKKIIIFEHRDADVQNYFSQYFRCIWVSPRTSPVGQNRIFKVIRLKCCMDLKHLELHGLCGELNPEHGELIKNQLARLESIKISDFGFRGSIYTGILQYCRNIKVLSISDGRDAQRV